MRFSEYFKLGRTQPYLDFVDIRLETDIPVFLDPSAIKTSHSTFGQECAALIQNYFETVLGRIRSGQDASAQKLVSSLSERNEFHLGYSRNQSRGHAFGEKSAESVWGALSKSQASISGLLKDLEDTCLLIEGIGRDMISDAVCNIVRGPLIRYTQHMCQYYNVPLVPDVVSGPIWNPETDVWESTLLPLPMTSEGKVILVPKVLVRHRLSYQYDEYYTHYLLPAMQEDEMAANTGLVDLLRDGTRYVTKKSLRKKYGSNKLAVVQQTLKRPHILQEYKDDKDAQSVPPLEHDQFSEIEGTKPPDWEQMLSDLKATPVGKDDASAYENIIEKILSALFYPPLCNPTKQHRIHDGRKRIDITYSNESRDGFFHWLSLHHSSSFIMVECKNYGREIGNPELDQLSGRFSPSRGQFGLLVCRSIEDRATLAARCRDTANDQRGFILVLDDADLEAMIQAARTGKEKHEYPLLRKRFTELVD
jgi:hypothetical protein